jgi:hypothetical protein
MRDKAATLAQIPANTCVVADDRIAAQLTRTNRGTVPGVSQHRQDFVVLDLSQPLPATTPEGWTTAEALRDAQDAGFVSIYRAGNMIVMRAPDYGGPSGECRP